MISDGSGGAFIIWIDSRGGEDSEDIYAQRISANGTALWQKDGLPLCTASRHQRDARMISDGAGGMIAVWNDYRDGDPQVFAQRVDGSGTILWQQNGVPIDAGVGGPVTTDGAGGAFVVFEQGQTTLNVQRIDENGNSLWGAGGVSVSISGFDKYDPAIVADGMGGAVIAWAEQTSSPINTYWVIAQFITSDGTRYWGPTGIDLLYSTTTQFHGPAVARDGIGGAFVTAADGIARIFGRRIRHSGSLVVASQILNVIDYSTRSASALAYDGGGGAMAFWGTSDLYMRRLGGDGLVKWPSEIGFCSQPGTQRYPAAATGDDATTLTAWEDGRSGGYDIYAQKFDTSGAALWQPEGLAVCAFGGDQGNPRIVSDMRGGAIVAWNDVRSGNGDIYASVVNPQFVIALDSIGGKSVEAGETLAIQLSAAKIHATDTLTFATDAGTVLHSPFTFSATTGLFTWIPEASDAGDYVITFSVSDGFFVDEESIVVSVFVNGDRPPVFNAFKDVFVYEGGLVRIVASAVDPENDPITFSIDDPRYQHSDSVFTWQTAAGDSGDYFPLVTAFDGHLSDTARCGVHVLYFNAQKTSHDRMLGNIHPYFHWRENESAWSVDSDGYLSGASANFSVYSGVISVEKPGAFDSTYAIFRFAVGSSYYMVGFTSLEPDSNDFHRGNIDYGLDCNTSGNIRPRWASNYSYWNKQLPGGIFDCRITLNRNESTVRFDFEQVDRVRAPVSDFVEPYWSVVESRPVSDKCYIQANVGSSAGRLYDVWAGSVSAYTATLLAGYSAFREGTSTLVQWTLSGPAAGLRFAISRWSDVENHFVEIENPVIEQNGLRFSYRDTRIESGATYRYRVLAESEGGRQVLFETEPISIPALASALYQNYPNPFNPVTAISFYLPNKMDASVDIYDIGGHHIINLADGTREAGVHSVSWDGKNRSGIPVSAGVYFCRLRAAKTTITRKMILLR